ncbi:MAG: hypothetical protein ACOX3A_04340 [bacterium]|jgi:GNAT superfamily N-acetyltransferase
MSVEVRPVVSQWELETFLQLPRKIYENNPYWIPAHPMITRKRLLENCNPFFAHAHVLSFLAWEKGTAVARLSVIIDQNNPAIDTGFFGFFEAENNPPAVNKLFTQVPTWLKSQGKNRLLGPFTLSSNEEIGLLIEGFSTTPAIGLSYNPPYYEQLLTQSNLTKALDFFSYTWNFQPLPEKLIRVAERTESKGMIKISSLAHHSFRKGAVIFQYLYNQAMADNWYFSPLTLAEAKTLLRRISSYADQELLFLAYLDGNPVGFCFSFPDLNQILLQNSGIIPRGREWQNMITRLRLAILGVIPSARRRGVESILILKTLALAQRKGYLEINFSLIAENNTMVNRLIRKNLVDAQITAKYRVYELTI